MNAVEDCKGKAYDRHVAAWHEETTAVGPNCLTLVSVGLNGRLGISWLYNKVPDNAAIAVTVCYYIDRAA